MRAASWPIVAEIIPTLTGGTVVALVDGAAEGDVSSSEHPTIERSAAATIALDRRTGTARTRAFSRSPYRADAASFPPAELPLGVQGALRCPLTERGALGSGNLCW
jgi:hypothetical protein